MKKIFIIFVWLIFFVNVANAADNESDFETAKIRLLCALSSMSSYSGDTNIFARDILISRGWEIDALKAEGTRANVKAYMFSNEMDGHEVKILVVAGTEDLKDVEVDFRVGRVPLHEGTDEKIFVHRGFRDYTDLALSDGVKEYLLEELANNPDEIFYFRRSSCFACCNQTY